MKLLRELFDQGAHAKWKKTVKDKYEIGYTFFVNKATGEVTDRPTGRYIEDSVEYSVVFRLLEPEYTYTPDFGRKIELELGGKHPWNPPKEGTLAQFSLPEDTWEFHFSNENEKGVLNKSMITGSGNSLKVFGAAMEILKDAIKTTNPEYVLIMADSQEPSRIKLYDRLVGKKAKKKWKTKGAAYWLIKT